MSASLASRVQSAYPRSVHRSGANGRDSNIVQRPTTSMNTRQPFTNVFNQMSSRTLESPTLSGSISSRRRSKAVVMDATMSTESPTQNLYSAEIQSLLQSLRREDALAVQVDCLANYRTLVQTIDLRKTPLNCEDLCTLQQRENRIVQRNACRDKRYRSLIDVLQPSHISDVEHNGSNDVIRKNSSY